MLYKVMSWLSSELKTRTSNHNSGPLLMWHTLKSRKKNVCFVEKCHWHPTTIFFFAIKKLFMCFWLSTRKAELDPELENILSPYRIGKCYFSDDIFLYYINTEYYYVLRRHNYESIIFIGPVVSRRDCIIWRYCK